MASRVKVEPVCAPAFIVARAVPLVVEFSVTANPWAPVTVKLFKSTAVRAEIVLAADPPELIVKVSSFVADKVIVLPAVTPRLNVAASVVPFVVRASDKLPAVVLVPTVTAAVPAPVKVAAPTAEIDSNVLLGKARRSAEPALTCKTSKPVTFVPVIPVAAVRE